ncbi:unnamed protein product [Effrenium voratum]|uniref:Uncharacterized protein n=1 Tax=Effrenium voratum TaxID=2562239 RepID=A0AA36MYS5_9DINO|nr:unnamed protein product [Effrenium voratum]CAJ1442422.1 unnamed protein product [Effrenium voratum]
MSSLVSAVLPSSGNWNTLQRSQLDVLQTLVKKHIEDPALTEIASGNDFAITSTERGVPRYEHSHLVAALDVLLEYQRNRKTTYFTMMGTRAQTSIGTYRHDPRTRLIELLKRWLRTHAANPNISEEEVRRLCGLCRDLLNYPNLFPSRNKTSFMHALSEVYEHLELQLRQVLERDRTCAELAARCLSLSRNLVSDAIAFLLLGATHLTQTDSLPSLEVVVLWQSLPARGNPLPSRADPQLQKTMQDAWQTLVGSLITALLSLRWTFHLFAGVGTEEELKTLTDAPGSPASLAADKPAENAMALIKRVREEFEAGRLKSSGLAGPFREPLQQESREQMLLAVEALFDLLYLQGEVLSHFHRISDSLGDYGMIRVSSWLHPCLDSVIEKVQRLQTCLKGLNKSVDSELIIAKARGRALKKPLPTERMSARAHAAMERALVGPDCHLVALMQSLEELKARSSPERLPHVVEGLGDACMQLQNVLTSSQFRARVGDTFPHHLPSLANLSRANSRPATLRLSDEETMGDYSEPEEEKEACASRAICLPSAGTAKAKAEEDSPAHSSMHSACFYLFGQAEASARRRSGSLPAAVRATFNSLRQKTSWELKEPSSSSLPAPATTKSTTAPAPSPASQTSTPAELVTELPADGWISHVRNGGRVSWHHTSLGPAPWERPAARPEDTRDELFGAKACMEASPVSYPFDDSSMRSITSPQRRDTNPFSDALAEEAEQTNPFPDADQHDQQGKDKSKPSPVSRATEGARAEPLSFGLPREAGMTPSTASRTQSPAVLEPEAPATLLSRPQEGQRKEVPSTSADPASSAASFLQRGCLRAEVQRLTTSVQGWKFHDSRSLLITGSQLLIYDKGSADQVKTVVDISAGEVERCNLLYDGVLSLEVRRKRRRSSSLTRWTPRRGGDGDAEKKLYFFKFEPQELAQQFSEVISSLRPAGRE